LGAGLEDGLARGAAFGLGADFRIAFLGAAAAFFFCGLALADFRAVVAAGFFFEEVFLEGFLGMFKGERSREPADGSFLLAESRRKIARTRERVKDVAFYSR